VHTSKGFFLGGRAMPFWIVGMSLVVADIGTTDLVGLPGQSFRHGLVIANMDWIGSFPALIIAAFIFVPFYWRAGVSTVHEFRGRRYGPAVRTVQAAIWIPFLVLSIGIVFNAVGKVLGSTTGFGYWPGILVTAAVIGSYALRGGLASIVLTDVAQ